jgi:hypothetical protein
MSVENWKRAAKGAAKAKIGPKGKTVIQVLREVALDLKKAYPGEYGFTWYPDRLVLRRYSEDDGAFRAQVFQFQDAGSYDPLTGEVFWPVEVGGKALGTEAELKEALDAVLSNAQIWLRLLP